jgi:quaternary ammonium compound-resistance protein SugE
MAWVFLLCAGACEMIWPFGFKYTNGFKTNYGLIALTFGVMTLSLWLMGQATARGIHVGTAYAVWTGLGAVGTVLIGMFVFNEPRDAIRITCLALIISGALGLKFLAQPTHPIASAVAP